MGRINTAAAVFFRRYAKIGFRAAQNDRDVGIVVPIADRLHPLSHVEERLLISDVEENQNTVRFPKVRLRDRPEPLLT